MAENKTQPGKASVQDYLKQFAEEQRRDCRELTKIMREATGERAVLWGDSLVGFGQYHYRYDSGREGDFFLTGFSPRKRNLSIYIMPGFERYERQLARLGKHKLGRSCLYVNRLADIDVDVLRDLVKDSVSVMRARYPD